jgi:hypothetical protein
VAAENGARLIASEDSIASCRVCEKLRRPLINLMGPGGFNSLLHRSLTLAQRESPALAEVEVRADGSMVGLKDAAAEASPTLVAHLIRLLITFIGGNLTLMLLHDIWPEIEDLDEPPGKDSYEKQGRD